MKIFALGKKPLFHRLNAKRGRGSMPARMGEAGNIFFALFAAVAMVGAVGFGFNSVMRGPISSMTETTKRTVAENSVINASRLAIVSATTQQTNNGNCDTDDLVEPMPYRDAGTAAHPTGGGYLPTGMMDPTIDPWNTEYGYCAWDSGTQRLTGCGTTGRLAGAPGGNQYAIAIISAGKDHVFQTSCNAYADTTPADGKPDTLMVNRPAGSDDIVLGYTYAEANNLGNGMWKPVGTGVAATANSLEIAGAGTFSDKVVLTGGGLVLPDQNAAGACDPLAIPPNLVNNKQLRRNTSTTPPTIEICDLDHSLGWIAVSGAADDGGMTGQMVSRWKLDETSGTVADDSVGANDGTLQNTPAWLPSGGAMGGAINVAKTGSKYVSVEANTSLEPKTVSIALWVKRHGTQAASSYILNKGGSINSYGLAINASQTIDFITGSNTLNAPFMIPDETWTHIIAVYEPSGTAPQKRLYINGILQSSETRTAALAYDTAGKLFFGSKAATGTDRVTADLDDIRLYNKALTEADITKLYSNTQPAILNLKPPTQMGSIYSWGDDTNNELGNGSSTSVVTYPAPATGASGFVQVTAGDNFSCGLKASGTIWCWGSDTNGQLGNGSVITAAQNIAQYQVANAEDVVKIAAGAAHACALQKNGAVWCWGAAGVGRLGNNTTTPDVSSPVAVTAITDFVDIDTGGTSSCGVRKNGEAYCWGLGTSGQLGNGGILSSSVPVKVSTVTDFVQIAIGETHACGTTKTGKVWCWGKGTEGQLGNTTTTTTNAPSTAVSNYTDFVQVAVSNNTSCGLRAGGEIRCWGEEGTTGKLGNGSGTTSNQTSPSLVSNISDFTKVSVGYNHVCGVRRNNEAWCWGSLDSKALMGNGVITGTAQHVPTRSTIINVIDLSAGNDDNLVLVDTGNSDYTDTAAARKKLSGSTYNNCFIRADGTAWCLGNNNNGQIGNGIVTTTNGGLVTSPTQVSSPGPWAQISAGEIHTCGIKSDGTGWCWGHGGNGALGAGALANAGFPNPLAITTSGVTTWSQISAGSSYNCGIKTDGTAWCWGIGGNGQLGNSPSGSSTTPAAVSEAGPWYMITAGNTHSCGIKTDGTAWCWGVGSNGQLGNGTTTASQTTPSKVSDSGPWKYIVAGAIHSCGIKADGSAWCWGADTKGELGNGAALTGNRTTPTRVASTEKWAMLTASVFNSSPELGQHTCGITVDGSAYCWGGTGISWAQTNLMLGTNDTTANNVETPARVLGGGKYSAITTNLLSTCGMKQDSTVWCWGLNNWGQLGNGTTTQSDTPAPMIAASKQDGWKWNDAGTMISPISGLSLYLGTGRWMSDTGAASRGLTLDGTATARLLSSGASDPNHLTIEAAGTRNSSQLSFKTSVAGTTRSIGIDYATGNLEFSRNTTDTAMVTSLIPDLEIDRSGNVGIGTTGNPAAKLDVNGAIRIGNDTVCGATKTGMIVYTGGSPLWKYCDKDGNFQPFTRSTGGTGTSYWDAGLNSISAGPNGNFAIKGDGTIYGWGQGEKGVFADGNTAVHSVTSPTAISTAKEWVALDGGKLSACGIKANGTLWCWGDDSFGQLGNGAGGSTSTPGQVGTNADWISITVGEDGHACGIRVGGAAYCWGREQQGRLGNGGNNTSTLQQSPVAVVKPPNATTNGKWINISAGYLQTCGVMMDPGAGWGNAYCWGGGPTADGQTFFNGIVNPNLVSIDPDGWVKDWVMMSAGWHLTCGIRTGGRLYCSGPDTSGQVGNGATTVDQPKIVAVSTAYTDWVYVSVGSGHVITTSAATFNNPGHACALRANGTIWCWGDNTYDQLGTSTAGNKDAPTQVCDDTATCTGYWSDWVSVAAGDYHTCGTRADGSIWCWGRNNEGQFGNGGSSNSNRPVKVQ